MTMEYIQQTISRKGLYTKEDGVPLITKRGGDYHWLFDFRRVFMIANVLEAIAKEFWRRHTDQGLFQLAGMETGAIPLLTALILTAPASQAPVNGLIIRKSRKTSGLGKIVEGEILDLPIILVDDTINSGTSAEKARSVLSSVGHEIRDMFVVLDFQSAQGNRWRHQHGITIQALFTLKDFDLPTENNHIKPTQTYHELWRTVTPGGIAYHVVPKSAPLLVGNYIYRGSDAAKMQAFSAKTGGLIWEYHATGAVNSKKGIWSSPAYHGGKLYFGAYNGTLYCLDATTGEEIWTHPDGEWIGSSPVVIPRHNLICIGIEYARPWAHGSLAAYNMSTGEKVWEHQVGGLQHGSPAYWRGGDLIIWGSADHEMLGLNAKTGAIIWRFPTRRSVKYAPAIDEKRCLTAFASFDKSIYLLDARTGEKLGEWVTGEICYTTPLFVGNKLFCGSGDRYLYVIDIEHFEIIKRIPLHARIYASPRLLGDRIIVGTNGGCIFEIDIETLEIKGTLQLPDAITNAVVVSDENTRIYVSTYMNHLYAFERILGSVQTANSQENNNSELNIPQSQIYTNAELVRGEIDVRDFIDEIKIAPDFWSAISKNNGSEQVFMQEQSKLLPSSPEEISYINLNLLKEYFPLCVLWVNEFARQEGKRIASMALIKLNNHVQDCHNADKKAYHKGRDRYHFILGSGIGSKLRCGDEEVMIHEGDVWWLDSSQTHHVEVCGYDQIHLIFDLEFPE